MTLGTGIVLAAIWLFPSACAMSKTTTGFGFFVGIATAAGATAAILVYGH